MGTLIAKFGGLYMEWSTTVDAPASELMTLEDLRRHTLEHEGFLGLLQLAKRLERVARNGTSSSLKLTPAELLATNSACGLDGKPIRTEAALLEAFGPGASAKGGPHFSEQIPIDVSAAMEAYDEYGVADSYPDATRPPFQPLRINKVFAVSDGTVYASVLFEDDPVPMPIVFMQASGQILTKNFAELTVRNVPDEQ